MITDKIRILEDVVIEADRAEAKFGKQLDTPSFGLLNRAAYHVLLADDAKFITEARFKEGYGSWADILVEEVAEALDEMDDEQALRTELVQVAAVVLRWIESIDERR